MKAFRIMVLFIFPAVLFYTGFSSDVLYADEISKDTPAEQLPLEKETVENMAGRFLPLEAESEYTLGTDDLVEISVWGNEELNREVIVRPDGRISFPLISDVSARGLTTTQLAGELEKKLSVYVRDPIVTVILKRTAMGRQEVFVLGELKSTGTQMGVQELREGMGVLELVSRIGGLSDEALSEGVKILRKRPVPCVISVNVDEMILTGDLSKNVILKAGDIVYIPKRAKPRGIFIMGEIAKPGLYKIEDAPNILELISLAGGPTKDAVISSTKLIRGEPEKPVVLSANIGKVISGADMKENLSLQSGDIVYVPKSFIGNLQYFMTSILPTVQFVYYTYYLTRGLSGMP